MKMSVTRENCRKNTYSYAKETVEKWEKQAYKHTTQKKKKINQSKNSSVRGVKFIFK